MATILLLRHAQASFGTDNYDKLSVAGHRQARVAAEHLVTHLEPISAVYCGTLQRQRETAAPLLEALQAHNVAPPGLIPAFVQDARLDEIDHERQFSMLIRRMTGSESDALALIRDTRRSSRDYQKVLKRVFLYWQELPEEIDGLESWTAFSRRIESMLTDIVGRSSRGQNAVVVTSGGVIAGIVQQVLKMPASGCYSLYEPLRNGALTRLLHDGKRISVSSYNDSSYLEVVGQSEGEESLLTYR